MPTTDPAKKRAQNRAAYQRRKQRRQQAQTAAPAAAAPDVTPAEPAEEQAPGGIEVEVLSPAASAPLSFTERMTARFKQAVGGQPKATTKQATKPKGKKVEVDFLTKSLPMASALVATYSRNWFRDPYKPCALQQAEATAILAPIFSMIERRVEITGHMSQDAMDLLASGLATVGYVGRMYTTYADIKERTANNAQAAPGDRERAAPVREDRGLNPDLSSREAAILAGFGRRDSQAPVSGLHDNFIPEPAGSFDGLPAQDDAAISAGDPAAGNGNDRERQLAVVARAFQRDFAYRSQNGLL